MLLRSVAQKIHTIKTKDKTNLYIFYISFFVFTHNFFRTTAALLIQFLGTVLNHNSNVTQHCLIKFSSPFHPITNFQENNIFMKLL